MSADWSLLSAFWKLCLEASMSSPEMGDVEAVLRRARHQFSRPAGGRSQRSS